MRPLLALGLVVMCAAAVLAAPSSSLYVRKTLVPHVVQQGTVYAPASALLAAMGYGWQACPEGFVLRPGGAAGPALKAGPLTLVVDGKAVSTTALWTQGAVYLPVKSLSQALGGVYIETPDVGMIQVSFPRTALRPGDVDAAVRQAQAAPPQQRATPPPTTSPAPVKPASTPATSQPPAPAAEPAREPFQTAVRNVVNNVVPGSTTPAELRGTVWVKNVSDVAQRNVKITMQIIDQGGQVFAQEEMTVIAAMNPGQEFTRDFLWYNYQNQYVTPKVKVEWAK